MCPGDRADMRRACGGADGAGPGQRRLADGGGLAPGPVLALRGGRRSHAAALQPRRAARLLRLQGCRSVLNHPIALTAPVRLMALFHYYP